jgi:hypothetical protein
MTPKFPEKRREPRHQATGRLTLHPADGGPGSRIEGQLMDISVHGFRAAHSNAGLGAGQEVRFEHAHARGRAKVVWTRVQGSTVETGFVVLED